MIIKKGAEASLFLEKWYNRKVIMKQRLPKKYRLPEIDKEIRAYRTIHEAQLLHLAKKAGVPTPTIFLINLEDSNIIMEHIEGRQVRQILNSLSLNKRQDLSKHIGELIGHLHLNDIVHGDLTTSNMILTSSGKVVFVDFGLGEKTAELEQKGVDLHLLKRVFQSTHFRYLEECFNAVLEGYSKIVGKEKLKKILVKIREIESRGRYISERGEV